jgi:hypothetical protein
MERRGATQPKHPPRHQPMVCQPAPPLTSQLPHVATAHHSTPEARPGLRAPPRSPAASWAPNRAAMNLHLRLGRREAAWSGRREHGRWVPGAVDWRRRVAVPRGVGLGARRDPVLCGPRGNKPRAVDVWAMWAVGRGRAVGWIWSGCGGMEGRKQVGADRRMPPRPTTAARHHARRPTRTPPTGSQPNPAGNGASINRRPRGHPRNTGAGQGEMQGMRKGLRRPSCRRGQGACRPRCRGGREGQGRRSSRTGFLDAGDGILFSCFGRRRQPGHVVHLPERRLPR